METIEIELEDGTVLEVSKDFLDASPEEQEAFLAEVAGTPPTPAEQSERTTSDVLTGMGSSAMRLAGNVLEAGEYFGDMITHDNPVELDIPNMVGADDETQDEMEARELANFEAKREEQGILGKLAGSINETADKMGRYRGETSGGDVIDAFREGRPLEGVAAAGRVGFGNAVAGAPEALPYLHPLTAAIQGVQNIGDTADRRAANDGREETGLGDLAAAAPAEALNATLGRLGVRVPVGSGLSGVLARTGIEGGTGVAQGMLTDAAETAGTDTGFDAERSFERGLEEGLAGIAGGAMFQGTGNLVDGVRHARDSYRVGDPEGERARMLQIEHKASEDIFSEITALQERGHRVDIETGGTQVARTLARRALSEYQQSIRDLRKIGRISNKLLTDEDGMLSGLETHFDQLSSAGKDAKNMQALPLDGHYRAIDKIDAPSSVKQALRDQVDYITTLSNAGVKIRQRQGPLGSLGRTYGGIVGHALGFEVGKSGGKTPAFASATAGSNAIGNFAGAALSKVDTLLGQSQPDIVREHSIRQRMLAREGLDAVELDLTEAVGPFSAEAAQARRQDTTSAILRMKDEPDTIGLVGSPRLKEVQEHQQITAGEALASIKDLVLSGELDKATARELLQVEGRMNDDTFYSVQDLMGTHARMKRQGRPRRVRRRTVDQAMAREEDNR